MLCPLRSLRPVCSYLCAMNRNWSIFSLIFLLLIAMAGTVLRAGFAIALPTQYGHFLHAHSHTAFQGWIYTAMMLLLLHLFLGAEQIRKGRYVWQFRGTVAAVTAVMITFSLQGYGMYSIVSSTVFQVFNYWFIYRFFRDVRGQVPSVSLCWVKTGLWLGILSTLAPFAIGILSAKGMGGSEAYRAAVYFFLHFQYNGWFQFVAPGLFFRWIESENIAFDQRLARRMYRLFAVAVVPGYTLSLLGMSFHGVIWVPATLAALLQVAGLAVAYRMWGAALRAWFWSQNTWLRTFLFVAIFSFFLKYALQLLSVIPALQEVAFTNRDLIVAYLHLCLLGHFTAFFLAMLLSVGWLPVNVFTRIGSVLFLTGWVLTEGLLVFRGLGGGPVLLPLLWWSAAMTTGVLLLILGKIKEK